MKQGEGLAILKYEDQQADRGFDPTGATVDIDKRRDQNLSLYGEYGLTGRLTLQGKASLTRGHDSFVDYDGRGPIELGLRYTFLRTDRSAVSLYLGAAKDGVGRNAGYARPGKGDADLEARLLAGTSGEWRGLQVFTELQAARLKRSGLADETRIDATLGLRPRPHWLVMAQAYTGQADSAPVGSRWNKGEISLVRDLGAWSLQAGWRQALSGARDPSGSRTRSGDLASVLKLNLRTPCHVRVTGRGLAWTVIDPRQQPRPCLSAPGAFRDPQTFFPRRGGRRRPADVGGGRS